MNRSRGLRPFLTVGLALPLVGLALDPVTQPEPDGASPAAYLSLSYSLAFGLGAVDPSTDSYAALIHAALSEEARSAGTKPPDFINLGRLGETSLTIVALVPPAPHRWSTASRPLSRASTAHLNQRRPSIR